MVSLLHPKSHTGVQGNTIVIALSRRLADMPRTDEKSQRHSYWCAHQRTLAFSCVACLQKLTVHNQEGSDVDTAPNCPVSQLRKRTRTLGVPQVVRSVAV